MLQNNLLTERSKRVSDKLVHNTQMAFIKGRQIMDATLNATECLDNKKKEDDTTADLQTGHRKSFRPCELGFSLFNA